MNYSSYRFTLDIHSTQSQVSIPVKLGDTARELYISLADGALPYVISDGSRAVFSAVKADGSRLLNDCTILNNAKVYYPFTDRTANVPGIMNCEILLYGKDGRLISSPRFIMVVDERVNYDYDEFEGDEKTTIDNIISAEQERAQAEEARVSAEANRASAEEARADAEAERVSAEAERVSAEAERVEFYNAISNDPKSVLTFDDAPEMGSNNLVTSGAVAQGLSNVCEYAEGKAWEVVSGATPDILEQASRQCEEIVAGLPVDDAPAEGSESLVTSGGVYNALLEKQDKLTIDDVPTYESPNFVTSGGICEYTQQYATEETLWEEIGYVYSNVRNQYATKDELQDVYDILGQTIIVEEELESEYTTRQTGDAIGILDGVMARMVRAYGSFETSEHDITPSTFEGIISTGNNILQLQANGWDNAWIEDGYWVHMRKDTPTKTKIAYMVGPTGTPNLIDCLQDGETYRVIQEPGFSSTTDSSYLFLQITCQRHNYDIEYLSNELTGLTDLVFTVDKSQYRRYEIWVHAKGESGLKECEYKFTVCLDRSGHKERALPYKDYGFRLSEPITLGGFDYIDFDAGKDFTAGKIVRRTEYATLEEPFELGALEPYVADYECSLDGLRVAYYRLDGDWQEEYIYDLPTRYKAYEFGYESPLPYGKCGNLRQAYYVKAGCIQ